MQEFIANEGIINKILLELTNAKLNLFGRASFKDEIPIKGRIDRLLDELTNVPEEILLIRKKTEEDFNKMVDNLVKEISSLEIPSKKKEIDSQLHELEIKLRPYLVKLEGQREIQKLTSQIEAEKQKFDQALNYEKQLRVLHDDYKNIRKKIVHYLQGRYQCYKEIVQQVNETRKDIGSEITLKCSLLLPEEKFQLFEQANKAALSADNIFHELFTNGNVNYDQVLRMCENQLRVKDNKLITTEDNFIPLKMKVTFEDVLQGLIADLFKLDYSVTYKGDDLLNMSPGKKGTVLLILFLQINSSEYPILIDQPEDNLDNRTIYDLLCKMIKLKKKERQIVIVSHNANLVVATDTENIIVANQKGQDETLSSGQYRFEYVNGSLEHTFPKNNDVISILQQQGIKEHVCDILEGGDEAFKQREKKYSIK